MLTIKDLIDYSLLAQAAYANFLPAKEDDGTFDLEDVRSALKSGDGSFTDIQSKEFLNVTDQNIPIVDEFGNPVSGLTVLEQRTDFINGFSATLFLDNVTGEKILSVRGTNGLNDLFTDVVSIAILGTTAIQSQYQSLISFYHELVGAGHLGSNESFSITGHSLGGFLAQAFSVDFSDVVSQAVTYNAPGIGGVSAQVLEAIGLTNTNIALSNITNVIAENGFSATAGLGTQLGNTVNIFIEEGRALDIWPIDAAVHNHSIVTSSDSLAIYDLLATIDENITLDSIKTILNSTSNSPRDTLESVVNSLGKLLLNDDFAIPEFLQRTENNGESREIFHETISALKNELLIENETLTPEFQGLTLTPLNALASEIKVKALGFSLDDPADAIAYRYALVNLNPFVITGNNAVYAEHNNNGELELFDETTGEGTLTEQYLTDRAAFLALKIELGIADQATKQGTTNLTYIDQASQLTLDITRFTGSSVQLPHQQIIFTGSQSVETTIATGGTLNDRLYGFLGNDILVGGKGADYLEGGAGNDTLYSGSLVNGQHIDDHTPDILVGGEGFDTYYAGLNDVIRDSDGQGEIRINGEILPLGNITLISGTSDLYTNNDPDNPVRFRLQQANGSLQLIGSFVTVEGFTNGDFGIHLDPNITTPGLNYIEGTEFDDRAGSTDPDAIRGGIGGTEGADEIHGLGGDDDIDGFEGDDVIFGGDGDDILVGGEGHDVLDGGDGRDILLSGIGKDILLGGAGDDFLSGFDDDDFLEGGDGNDFLAGGSGSDTLLGGNGDDVLMGDGVYFAFDRNWQVTVTDTRPGIPGGEVVSFNGSITGTQTSEDDQADYLDGGAGNDVLFGGGGNDQLFGGDGHDSLIGGDGDDYLDGGDGDDYLEGDDRNDPNATGNDTLFGGAGNDILDGGPGDDYLSGGDGNDQLWGGDGNDTLYGDDGDDMIFGQAGDDFADGGAGNDQIDGGDGDDVLFGGAGNDLIRGGTGKDFIDGGDGDDQLFGDEDDDIIHGGAGMDMIDGGDGNDILFGGLDNDVLLGGAGDDELHGDEGDDQLQGGDGDDILHGGDGNDVLFGEAGDDQLFGGAGDDQLIGGIGNDLLDGGDGNDILWGGDGDDILRGGAGNDQLFGEAGHDHLDGGDGDDILIGSDGNDVLEGGAGQDELQGGEGDDVLSGGAGNDVLFGENGNDSLFGGSGDDILIGGAGFDFLSGGDGNDELQGGSDDDILHGDAGNDRLFGDDGNDILHGGTGDDLLVGDAGNDVYLFNIGDGRDTIIEQGDTSGDYIILGEGIAPEETYVNRSGNDLVIKHTYDSNDSLTVRNWYLGPEHKLDRIEFADGTVWNQAMIEANLNLPPVANPDMVSGDEDTDIIISAATLTANDIDPNGNSLSVIQVSNPVNGTVALNQEGDVVFTPHADFTGQAFFDYTVTDNRGGFDTQTVTVNVLNVNDAPVANPDASVLILQPTDPTIPPDAEPVLTGRSEFLVNTFTQNRQDKPSITSLSNRGFVVIWSGNTFTGDSTGITGQLFDEFGNKVGTEFIVNTKTSFGQSNPDVTELSDASFVVVWETQDASSGDTAGIAGQVFNISGGKTGTEFLVNTVTTDLQISPSVTGLANGSFVVTWINNAPIGGQTISAQIFNSTGDKVGSEFLVNTTTAFLSSYPVIAGLPDGRFVISWSGATDETGFANIAYQIFSANSARFGTESVANTHNFRNQSNPDITVLENGNFVITWQGSDPATGDTSGEGISGQLFDSTGNKIGNEFLVNSIKANQQINSSVTALADGSFVVVWENTNFSSISEIAGQQFDPNGNKAGGEFQVNEFTASNQVTPAVAALPDGGFAVVWGSDDPATGDPNGTNGLNSGISGRIYRYVVPRAADNTIVVDVLANDTDVDNNLFSFTLDSVTLQGNKGEASIVNNRLFYDAGSSFEYLDEGAIEHVVINYTMSDADGASSSSTATITIIGVNDVPYVDGGISDQEVDEDTFFNFTFPREVFTDPDANDSLFFSASLSDGSHLPTWLGFDINTLIFNGTPENDDVGIIDIQVTAADLLGESASTTFSLKVTNTNDKPELNNPLSDQFINAVTDYNFTVPADTFFDIDSGDLLTYNSTLENGDPLPDWLSFYPLTRHFSGMPNNSDRGTIFIKITVTDNAGEQASDIFNLTINAIPELGIDTFDILTDLAITLSPAELLSNDSDFDGDALYISSIGNPTNGTVSFTIAGDIIFIPDTGFNGSAGFEYTVGDGRGGFSRQDVIINVFNPVYGDAADNILEGTTGRDLIEGGSGNDTLIGGSGDDIYLFGRGDGNDVIIETDTAQGGDVLRFAEDIAFADVQVSPDRKDLVFTLKDTGDSVTLQKWKSGKNAYPITVEFGDGTVLTSDDLNVKFNSGGSGNDTVRGSRVNDYLYGLGGNDRIIAKDGDDVLDGGAGNDILVGGAGNDIYQFTSGWGNDTIIEDDATPGNTDTVAFGSGLLTLDLMFNRSGDDLLVSQIGTTDTIAIQNWYLGSQYQTEIFQVSDGSALLNTQVDQLIQAMAGFSAESGLDWSSAAQQRPEEVETILASSWQSAI